VVDSEVAEMCEICRERTVISGPARRDEQLEPNWCAQDELVGLYETLPAVGDAAAAMPRARVSEVRGQSEARADA